MDIDLSKPVLAHDRYHALSFIHDLEDDFENILVINVKKTGKVIAGMPQWVFVLRCGNCSNSVCESLKDDEYCCDCSELNLKDEGCSPCISREIEYYTEEY